MNYLNFKKNSLLAMIFISFFAFTSKSMACTSDSREPNNSASFAYDMGTGTAYTLNALCLTANDNDYFKFSVSGVPYYIKVRGYSSSTVGRYRLRYTRSGNTLTIETRSYNGSTTDTYLQLYSSNGTTQLASNDDGGTDYFSKVIYTIPTCIDSFEPNNTVSQSSYLGSGTSYTKNNLCLTADDKDYFRFSVGNKSYYIKVRGYSSSTVGRYRLRYTRSGNTLTIETRSYNGSTTDTYLQLYSSNGTTQLASNDDGGTDYFSKIIYTIPTCTDSSEPNNTVSQASYLGTGTSYTKNNLCLTADDKDYFKFSVGGASYYVKVRGYSASTVGRYRFRYRRSGNTLTIETQSYNGSTTDTYLELYTSNGTIPLTSNDDGGTNYFSKIIYTIPACTDSFEPNNTVNQARQMGNTIGSSANNLCITPNDNDYFIFYANGEYYYIKVRGYSPTSVGRYNFRFTRHGNTLTIETQPYNNSTTDTYLYLYSSNGTTVLASNDDGGTDYFSKIIYTLPSAIITPTTDNPSPPTPQAKVESSNIQQTDNVSIRPNPLRVGRTSKLNIETEDVDSSVEVIITDISGRVISRKTVEVHEHGIEIPPFDNSGIYIISVHTGNSVSSVRLIVTE